MTTPHQPGPPASRQVDTITMTTFPGTTAAQTFTDIGQAVRAAEQFLRGAPNPPQPGHAQPAAASGTTVVGGGNEHRSVTLQLNRLIT